LDLGLAAQPPVGADLLRHPGDFGGKGVQLIDHLVDDILYLQNFAADIDCDFLGKVTVGDSSGHFGHIAKLDGEMSGEAVNIVSQVLPSATDAFDIGLAPQLSFRADLLRHARDFGGEGPQCIDHRVDGVFQFKDLTFRVNGYLLGQVAVGDCGRNL